MSCATVAVLASGLPEPTFLESGSNDLIRFQKGEVPAPPVTLEAAPSAAPEPVEPAEMRAPEHRLMDSEGLLPRLPLRRQRGRSHRRLLLHPPTPHPGRTAWIWS